MMIVVNESAAASYLYLMGLTIDEELPLTQHLSLLPATCKASPDDMINSVMKYGSGDETDLGVLIAVLRKTTAQLRVVGEGKELAVRVWNAQSAIVLLSALLNCELYWHVQSDSRTEDFSPCSAINVVLSTRLFIPRKLKVINDSEKQWIRQHYRDAWELFDKNTRFETAVNSLWSYKQSLRPSVQMAIIWAGIESLFGVRSELVFRVSTLAALFLGGGKQKQQEIKKLYRARSEAVHEGKQPSESCVSDSAKLLQALILECVERGCLPNEDGLLLDSKKDRLNDHLSPYEYLQMRHRCVSVALHRQDNEKAANQEWRFANMVYPEFSPTASLRAASNETHNGVWAIPESLAQRYCEFLDPVILRRSVATQTANASSICNFGKAKGRTYDHVLIYPVADMASWLQDASTDLKPQTRSKLYVAITRARFSAGFVVADNKINELPDTLSVWKP